MIDIYPDYRPHHQDQSQNFVDVLKAVLGLEIIPLTCGRSALLAGVQSLSLSRQDEILVPPFVSQCVLSALSRSSFPSMTISPRTKAIMVFHQFGFPQDISAIEAKVRQHKWAIINNAAHALLTTINGRSILDWGDVTAVSFSKTYPCILGGGLITRRADLYQKIRSRLEGKNPKDQSRANKAFEVLQKAKAGLLKEDADFEISKVYGCLPDLLSVPEGVLQALPGNATAVTVDREHRKNIWAYFQKNLPEHIPQVKGNVEMAPFAVPVRVPEPLLNKLPGILKTRFNIDVPVLHFDYACNMLCPDYQKALVIGCHLQWDMKVVHDLGETIKDSIYERI